MKHYISSTLLLLLSLLAFSSCEKEQDMWQLLPLNQATKPALSAIEPIVITQHDIANGVSIEIPFTQANYGQPTNILHSLVVRLGERETPITSAVSSPFVIKKELLNKAMLSVGAEENSLTSVELYVRSELTAKGYELESTPMVVDITTAKPLFPDNVYMIGQEFGAWNWSDPRVAEMTPVNGNPGKFWAIRYVADEKQGFKWNTRKDWGGDFNSLGANHGFTVVDGNAFVAAPGLYMFFVDYTTETITIEPAKVYGIGDAFGSWDMGAHPFTAEGGVMKITTSAPGNLRMYAITDAAAIGGDWWRMEFNIFDGKVTYRGNGGDQAGVPVTASNVVTLDFNAGTGSIQ